MPRSPFALLLVLVVSACGDPPGAAEVRPDGQLQAAEQQLAAGQASGARGGFEAVLESDPGNIDARLGLAESARLLGDDPAAERAFEEVLGLGADRSSVTTALRGLAEIRRSAGDESAAAELEAKADSLSDDSGSR